MTYAHETSEKLTDKLSHTPHGVDMRSETLPSIMYLTSKYLLPILKEVDVDYDKMSLLGGSLKNVKRVSGVGGQIYNYRNCDKIEYIRFVIQGLIEVGEEEMKVIER
ncbi:hypothetical protein TL16_g10312 [Triparma laevis f. inornata]|uniref:Uncharacterized protein n=1 Tax=Triparma laevis f. inornata TaxID=1714386 RepID=A0A9W7BGE8_9STRA|nr:hypothetical protein TL16_g10312 [Triparma laevis f. inornata]